MREDEIYEFDLNGYIVYRQLIDAGRLEKMNQLIDADLAGENPSRFSFLGLDTIFMELLAHPRTLNIIRVLCGDWLRLDHAYGIQMTAESQTRENLHGGPRADQGEHQYQWQVDRMYNGLIVVMYALEDVNPNDGGFICVPGSHKANLNYKPPVHSHLVVNPALKAGDMLIFTEALVHGTIRWQSRQRRRSLLYKYSPGYSTWGDPQNLKRYEAMATSPIQRDLLRPPGVGKRTPLDFPPVSPQ